MKKMKMLITLAGALCVLTFAAGAWAQDEDSNDQPDLGESDLADAVDFAEAVENAVLIDWFVDENQDEWEVYRDELQKFSWEQRAGMSPDDVIESLESNGLDTRGLMEPYFLRFRYRSWWFGCQSGTSNTASYDSFFYDGSCGTGCYLYATYSSGGNLKCVYDIGGIGVSGASNYCTMPWSDKTCWIGNGSLWFVADTCDCNVDEEYWYLAQTDDLNNWDIDIGDTVVKFTYKIDSSTWRTMIIAYYYIE